MVPKKGCTVKIVSFQQRQSERYARINIFIRIQAAIKICSPSPMTIDKCGAEFDGHVIII